MAKALPCVKIWNNTMKSITEIKETLERFKENELDLFILEYKKDTRSGVKKLIEIAEKRLENYRRELDRLHEMTVFEREFSDCEYICGVDEVGRGPLAGPVVAAAVIMPKNLILPYVNDSKKLSEKKREALFDDILTNAVSVGLGSVDNHVIDEVNILNATFLAMKKAVEGLSIEPDMIFVDGNRTIPNLLFPQKAIVKGDSKSFSIACASILAKVSRDRKMLAYSKEYPLYDLENNKGYGSKKHYEGIRNFGLSPIHRRSFIHE